MRLLLVEDDNRVARIMQSVLRKHGYQVVVAGDGHSALDECDESIDMVLLDLGLPDVDGTDVCTRLRTAWDVPIIAVTARSELTSMVHVLGLGADDYLVKPFDLRELIARIEAVGRRQLRTTDTDEQRFVSSRGVRVDLAARKVWVADDLVMLTRKEFDLVAALARRRGVAVRREQLISEVWQTSWQGMGRSLEVHIASVRRKLSVPGLIETVRGIGYAMIGD